MPEDLLAVASAALLTMAFVLVPQLDDLPVRVPLGLAMVLFLPGYALIAALFPRKDDLDGIERVALSFGLSIAVVPLIGLGLNYTPWGIRLVPVVVSLVIFTVAMSVAACIRRSSVASSERFSTDVRKTLSGLRQEILSEESSRLDKALTVILIITILLSISALAYVIITPKQGEKFTEFYILGPDGKAYDYPTSVTEGNTSTVIVGVVNHEYALTNYTMSMRFRNETLMRREIALIHNETWEEPVSYVLKNPGHNQKLEFLLYRESNFTEPYRDLHLWINTEAEEEAQAWNESGSEVPMVSLPEIQMMILDYSHITPRVLNVTKVKHRHSHSRERVNVTQKDDRAMENATLPGQDTRNDTGITYGPSIADLGLPELLERSRNVTQPITHINDSPIAVPELMERSRNVSKSYEKINATPIEPGPGMPEETPEDTTSAETGPAEEMPANGTLAVPGPSLDASENGIPAEPGIPEEMPANETSAEPGMPEEAPEDIATEEPQQDPSLETPSNGTSIEPQTVEPQEVPTNISTGDENAADGSQPDEAQKPMVLGRGPIREKVVLGRSSASSAA